ncbi:MAG: LytTR family transcriptional regulator [Alistipes sp.]|nr:LytTR family transcriptional regulator [Alistipes sp.]
MAYNEISKFLVSSRYMVVTIISVVLFSAIFLITYEPFSLAMWFDPNNMVSMLFTLLFYVSAIVILILSRYTMYKVQDRYVITTGQYVWWLIAETIAITILYTFVTYRFFANSGLTLVDIGMRALFCIAAILGIPNAVISFYAGYRSKCEELEAAQYELKRLGEEYNSLLNKSEVERRVSEMIPKSGPQMQSPRMVRFYDNGGTLRLTIDINALYYMESEDNYIKIHYKHNDKILSYMLRCKTSTIEKSLEGSPMVRCHRSYIVNTGKIRFMGEEHRMHFITLDDDSIKRIPVSKSYYSTLLASLNTIGTKHDKAEATLQEEA